MSSDLSIAHPTDTDTIDSRQSPGATIYEWRYLSDKAIGEFYRDALFLTNSGAFETIA